MIIIWRNIPWYFDINPISTPKNQMFLVDGCNLSICPNPYNLPFVSKIFAKDAKDLVRLHMQRKDPLHSESRLIFESSCLIHLGELDYYYTEWPHLLPVGKEVRPRLDPMLILPSSKSLASDFLSIQA
jgi:hypothetical protein